MNEKEIILTSEHRNETAECHLMPCRIEHDNNNRAVVAVKAQEYFWPTIKELKEGGDEEMGRGKVESVGEIDLGSLIMTASFRGRPLQGRKLQVPSDYKGYLLVDGLPKKEFNEFSYWNWDELPNNNDTVVKALNWINISKAIHE